jgi:putative transposase
VLCKTLEVSESGYYAWKNREPSQHCREDARLSADIQQIFLDHRQVYGSPRIHAVLKTHGMHCSRKRVVRLMQQLGLSAQLKKRRKPTMKSSPGARFAPNHLEREFEAAAPNSKWVSDTTAIETTEGWLYLAVLLDLFSRMVVGWAFSAIENAELTELALRMALAQRRPPAGLLHHSDWGSEFTSDRYQTVLREAGIQVSMSRTGDCYDNAAMEAFFATVLATYGIHRPESACENTQSRFLLLVNSPEEEYHLKHSPTHLHQGEWIRCKEYSPLSRG